MTGKRKRGRPIQVPPLSQLLRHYAKAGAPVRSGFLFHIYASPQGKAWVVLYVRFYSGDFTPLEFTSDAAREGRLIRYGTGPLNAIFRSFSRDELRVLTFSSTSAEDAQQFKKAAFSELGTLIDSPAMRQWVEKSATVEAEKERLVIQKRRQEKEARDNPQVNPMRICSSTSTNGDRKRESESGGESIRPRETTGGCCSYT